MHTPHRVKKAFAWALGTAAVLLTLLIVLCELAIGWGIERESNMAMKRFHGDRIEALIAVVDSPACSIEDRNHAVWALGQLRDKRALPVLQKYRTGKPCSHWRHICQYEIGKAIRWTEGNSLVFPQFWRVLLTRNQPEVRS